MQIIAGTDEVGRGSLAGPVLAAAVILNPKKRIRGLADSKALTSKQRETLAEKIQKHAIAWAIGEASVEEINTLNIHYASLLAMQRAIAQLNPQPHCVLVDGRSAPSIDCEVKTIVQGDVTEPAISAASIIAKVARDKIMLELDQLYPEYQFAKHKGYGTKTHRAALLQYGPSKIHRCNYLFVKEASLQFLSE